MRYVLLALITIGMMTYAVIDCVRTDDSRIRLGLPHWFWVAAIILLPFAGALLWLIVSNVNRRKYGDGPSARPQRPKGPVAPDDDPDFLFRLERDRRRAQKERDASEGTPGKNPGPTNPPTPPADPGSGEPGPGEEDHSTDPDDDPEAADQPASEDDPAAPGASREADDEPLYIPEEFTVPDFRGDTSRSDSGEDDVAPEQSEPAPPEDDEAAEDDDGGQPSGKRRSNDDENGRR